MKGFFFKVANKIFPYLLIICSSKPFARLYVLVNNNDFTKSDKPVLGFLYNIASYNDKESLTRQTGKSNGYLISIATLAVQEKMKLSMVSALRE